MRSTLVRGGLLALVLAGAVQAPTSAQGAGNARIPFESYRLENGLRVILAPDRSVPTVAVNVWYDVGARDERPGRTGFAHLFEHMMFQGSANVGKGEHMTLVERAGGGDLNGTTDSDRTNYYQTLPANRLNLGLWLEADRMRSLAVTAENFENQREVVKEEKRQRLDNAPYGASLFAMINEIPYNAPTCFGYAHLIIGSMDDLNAATVEDAKAFHDTYYRPNNATLTITGDFDGAEAKRLVQQYFGSIPAGTAPPRTTCAEPFRHLPVTRTVEDKNAQLHSVMVAYGLPEPNARDLPALEVLHRILGEGESSRLTERLVNRERAALQTVPFFFERRGPGIAFYWMIANQGVEPARLQALFDEEVERVRSGGVTEAELQKAKNRVRAERVLQRQTPMGLAEELQHYAHFHGGPEAIQGSLDAYLAVTLDDVKRVAGQYYAPGNRAVLVTTPAAAAQE